MSNNEHYEEDIDKIKKSSKAAFLIVLMLVAILIVIVAFGYNLVKGFLDLIGDLSI